MKLHTFKQLDSMDCGAACLQDISKYYGKYFSLQRLRDLCHITKNGVSLLGISDAAESIGFRTVGVKLTWEQLKDDAQLPCIVHWNQSHFIIVSAIKQKQNGNFVIVSDPAGGVLKYKQEDFLRSWLQIKCEKGEMVVKWSKSEFVKYIAYYKLMDLPFIMHLESDYDHLSPKNIFFAVLCHEGKTDSKIQHIMGISAVTVRSDKSRIKARLKQKK